MDTPSARTVPPAWRHPLRRLRAHWLHWWRQRLPHRDTVALTHRNVYIVPTRAGLMLAVTLLVLLIASINYQLSLGYLLTFLLAGTSLAGMHACHGALRGLSLQLLPPEPGFCGSAARLHIVLHNPQRRIRRGLGLRLEGQAEPVWCDVPAQGSSRVELAMPLARRGWHGLPLLVLETRYPLGAFRAWALWQPAARLLAYPAPEQGAPPLPEPPASGAAGSPRRSLAGREERDAVRPYRPGDTPRQVLWKKTARTGTLVSRDDVGGPAPAVVWLDLSASGMPLEPGLSRLCAWVLDAERRNLDYGLSLPGRRLGPAHGPAHAQACLRALALA